MPVTFLAHQAPVLPLLRRRPRAVDGLTVVIGSMAPDLAYALSRSRFAVDAHDWPGVVTFGVPVTLVVSWIVVRLLAPVVPAHLPDAGSFHLQDYRGLAAHRFAPVAGVLGAVAGIASHVLLDELTHRRGWLADHLEWWAEPVVDGELHGRTWTPYRIAQYTGHVVGSAVTVWLLWRYGRQRWFARAAAVVPVRRTAWSALVLWSCTAVGAGIGVGQLRFRGEETATGPIRLAATTFAGMVVGALVVRWRSHPVAP